MLLLHGPPEPGPTTFGQRAGDAAVDATHVCRVRAVSHRMGMHSTACNHSPPAAPRHATACCDLRGGRTGTSASRRRWATGGGGVCCAFCVCAVLAVVLA
eukprot:6009236-Prymnesium_polylepis.1